MKKILIPNDVKQLENSIDVIDGIIIGIKGLSVNFNYEIKLDELQIISELIKNKEIFISLNKNIENSEIDDIKSILLKLNNYKITGILYSDPCFINFKKYLNEDIKLIWSQEHLTTNYETINYWNNFGSDGALISSDITMEEISDIQKQTNCILMTYVFGYLPMFVSKRHIVNNYLNKFNSKKNSDKYYIEKENKVYSIIDNNIGTQVFSNNIFNPCSGYNYLLSMDYLLFNGYQIDNNKLREVLSLYNNLNSNNINEINSKINQLFSNLDEYFMYNSTVSRVKKHDK